MLNTHSLPPIAWLTAAMVVLPLVAFAAVALLEIAGRTPADTTLARIARFTFGTTTLAGLAAAVLYVVDGMRPVQHVFGHWFRIGEPGGHHYGFDLGVLVDGVALTYLALVAVLCGTVGAFSLRYMHGERGAGRFLQLLLLFAASLSLLVVADSLDLLFVGWELVGITSALLIAFYRERPDPVRHGFVAFVVYRICDAALLTALVVLHHATGSSNLPTAAGVTSVGLATTFGLLVLFASMGKSAQWPFSSWLPRAMEGPTPSSAIFYGALSIHAGAFLLLRTAPLWQVSQVVAFAVVAVGLVTAVLGTVVGRAQTDAKSTLAYAAIVQVGLVYAEIGLGLDRLALVHMAGHAMLRTLEFLRAPSLVAEHQLLEAELGRAAPKAGLHYERILPAGLRAWLYGFALERGYADAAAARLTRAARRTMLALDGFDRRVACVLDTAPSPGGAELASAPVGAKATERDHGVAHTSEVPR